jgi:hypothetical protein
LIAYRCLHPEGLTVKIALVNRDIHVEQPVVHRDRFGVGGAHRRGTGAIRIQREADRRALTPLIYQHVNPYGTFHLDLDSRLPFLHAA